jgi:hypothetical protein
MPFFSLRDRFTNADTAMNFWPQGLKPVFFEALIGPAEAVPPTNTIYETRSIYFP